jgi:hypothetical protein
MPDYKLEFINKVSLPEFQEWTDRYGMMQDNDRGETTGNGNLFTAHYAFGLYANDLLTDEEKDRIEGVFLNNYRLHGLLMRSPTAYDSYQAHDDIIGLMSADALINPETRDLTKAVYEYGLTYVNGLDDKEKDPPKIEMNKWAYFALKLLTGNKVRWVWNTVQPGKFHVASWLGRRLEMLATMQMALRLRVNPFCWLYWALSILKNYYFPNWEYRDGYTLPFHSAIASQGYGPLTDWVCKKARESVRKDYTDFGNLLGHYFAKFHHPIVKLCKGIW